MIPNVATEPQFVYLSAMSTASRLLRTRIWLVALGWALTAAPAFAQGSTSLDLPIGRFVFDVHGAVVPFGQNFQLATARGLDPETEPRFGLGMGAGVHLYVLRIGVLTVGLGGRVITASAARSPNQDGQNPDGPRLRKRFTAFAPELSLNFGGRDGWSYVSGGIGRSRLSLFEAGADAPPQRSSHTVNVGGGRALVHEPTSRIRPRPALLHRAAPRANRKRTCFPPHDGHGAQHRGIVQVMRVQLES